MLTDQRKHRRLDLQSLFNRATNFRRPKPKQIFTPSLIYRLTTDPFGVWCDYHAPPNEAVDETNRYDEMRKERGIDYEEQWVRKHYPNAVIIRPTHGIQALRETLKAMRDGARAIHAPQLWDLGHETYGRGDVILRQDSHGSDLGAYHYHVLEIKRSKTLQDYHSLQAATYNRILGHIQGYLPNKITVILKESKEAVTYKEVSPDLDDHMDNWREIRDGRTRPEPAGFDKTYAPWKIYANKILQKCKDLTLLPDVGPAARKKIRSSLNAASIPDLYPRSLQRLQEALGEKLGLTVYYGCRAYKRGCPVVAPGAKLSIPRAQRHLYLDFETSDEVHPTESPHVYLIGIWDKEANRFIYFLAHGAGEEEKIFSEFLDYVGNPTSTRLYHWTGFEIGVMEQIADRYPKLAHRLKRLIESCVDLKEFIKSTVHLPVPTYSIKQVAPTLGFHWRQKDVGAFESMTLYWDYLDKHDFNAVKKAVKYNEDDCVAMWHVDNILSRKFG